MARSASVGLRLHVAWIAALCLLLAGCGFGAADGSADANRLSVRSAAFATSLAGPVLALSLDCHLGETLRDALDHGIPLTLAVRLSSDNAAFDTTRRVELRYFPLSRRYVLRDRERSDILRSAVAPAYLVDALAALRLPLDRELKGVPAGLRWRVEVSLDRNALPGALRLPALLQRAWQLRAPEYAWTAAAG